MQQTPDLETFIRKMPKAELQIQLEGTMEPALKFQLSKRNGIELPYRSYEELKNSYVFPDTPTFLAALYEGCSLLWSEQDFYDLTYRFLKKTRTEHNVVYTELGIHPQIHTKRGVSFETMMKGVRLAQLSAHEKFGIESRLITAFVRSESMESHFQLLEKLLLFKGEIVGISFGGDGRGVPPKTFKTLIETARAEGLKVAMRNNLNQVGIMEQIRESLFDIAIDRLNDSVNCLEDDELVAEVVRRGLPQTICPLTVNYGNTTDKARRDTPWFDNEIPGMLEKGMKISLNTDDPAYFLGQYMNDILLSTQRKANLGKEQLGVLMLNAFESAWLDERKKQNYVDVLKHYIANGTVLDD